MTNYVMKEREKEKTNLICILLKFTTLLRSTYVTFTKASFRQFQEKTRAKLKIAHPLEY